MHNCMQIPPSLMICLLRNPQPRRQEIQISLFYTYITITDTSIYLQFLTFIYLPFLYILTSGDVHPNPGMDSGASDTFTSSTTSYCELLKSGISVMHLNIQSLRPKLDILQVETQPYDIVVLTETWLNPSVSNADLFIRNFQCPFRCDRKGRNGGGVSIYVRDGIYAEQKHDLSIEGVEALWVELKLGKNKILLGGFYRPPDSNNDQWLLMEQSLDQAFDKSYDNIIVTGDFNMHFLSQASDKIKNLIASYSAHQLIDTPTHFTETSSSLIDLIFVKNKNQLISSFVADPFIPELTRFHCPVVAVLKFDKPKFKSFKRHIWLYDKGNYDEYRNKLRNVDWNLLTDDNDPDKTIQNITDKIISVASKTIHNKTIPVRPNDIPSMNTEIRKLIRTRKRLHKEAKRLNNVETWSKFREARNTVTKHIRKAKLNYQNKLVEIINSSSTSPKTWFKVAKRLTQKQTTCTIPTLYDNNMEASTDISKADLLNSYFSRQSTLDDHDQQLPHNITSIESTLSHLTITPCDVKDAISLIDSSKASGPDFVSPKLLCEGSTELCSLISPI